jgi:hypothetical protein
MKYPLVKGWNMLIKFHSFNETTVQTKLQRPNTVTYKYKMDVRKYVQCILWRRGDSSRCSWGWGHCRRHERDSRRVQKSNPKLLEYYPWVTALTDGGWFWAFQLQRLLNSGYNNLVSRIQNFIFWRGRKKRDSQFLVPKYYVHFLTLPWHVTDLNLKGYTVPAGLNSFCINTVHGRRSGLDDRGSILGRGSDCFLFTTMTRPALGATKLPIQWVPGTFTLGLMRPRREADHSPPSTVEVKDVCSYVSPPYVIMTWCLIKDRIRYGT